MSLHLALLIVIGALSTGLGLLVYFQDKKQSTNKVFVLLVFSIVAWVVTNYLCDSPSGASYALFWNKITMSIGILIGLSLLYFSLFFPRKYTKISFAWSYLFLFISVIFIILSLFTNLIIKDIEFLNWGTNVIQGITFLPFVIWASILIIFPLIILVLQFKASQDIEKIQMKYVFWGLFLFLFFGFTMGLVLPAITGTNELARFGPYSMLFFIGLTSYAILKHHLLSIRIIATESLVVLLSLILFIEILLSKTLDEGLLRAIFFILVIYGGYALVKSVIQEIKYREELQKLSEDLTHANEHLKELDKMKTEFVSLASHELLTPVSAIEGYLSMTLDEKMAKIDDPKAVKYMDRVYTSAKRLARLVTDMLNVSRIEEGRLLVEKHDINLTELINQVIDELKFKAEEKKQKIIFQGIGGSVQGVGAESQESLNAKRSTLNAGLMTYGDPDKIKEIIVNLIGNSIKYSKNPGTITISLENVSTTQVAEKWQKIEEEIKARPLDDQEAIKSAIDERLKRLIGDEQILIHVKDQGVGIPKEELPRLFKKFHRVGDYTTAESQGTGLGLYISRALVELHHGRIWADSEGPSHGSTFTFSLPKLSSKQAIIDLEAQIPQPKEQLKPLARPTKEAEEI